ncbi:cytochrome-c peroxidase [Mesorhizobium sp. SP-1A]|uniref:cytochrome-c peroxidase n=1 Tax=Mesorhizobium sp. SP-1A TaxID=3077840 RepID=UPI0039657388
MTPSPARLGKTGNRSGSRSGRIVARLTMLALLLWAAARPALAQPMSRAEARQRAQMLSALGEALFSDPRLSASGRTACASCHDPAHAFAPANALAVQSGGRAAGEPGLRAVPSLEYLQAVPQFTEHYFESEDEADESVDNGPTGGLTWDGRADTGGAQARIPLLSPFEMGNADPGEVVRRALAAGYGPKLAAIYGRPLPADRDAVFEALLKALEVYQQSWQAFYPYSSKYDAWLAGKAQLTPQEEHGRALFEDPAKGNCASCHVSTRSKDGTPPQFTDYGMIALAVPRNPAIPANADPAYHDLGLCGPLRTDFAGRADYCGLFRTPTLRNVATRKAFFHNGVFHSLKQAVAFYASRDSDPARWYSRRADGGVDIYDDLPASYRNNVNMDPPFGGRAGDAPKLDEAEIDDIVAFLNTLTDGWRAP